MLCLGLEPRCDAVHPEVVLRYILKPSLRHPHHNRYTQWPCPCYRVVCAYFVSVAPHPPPVKVVPQLFVLLFKGLVQLGKRHVHIAEVVVRSLLDPRACNVACTVSEVATAAPSAFEQDISKALEVLEPNSP